MQASSPPLHHRENTKQYFETAKSTKFLPVFTSIGRHLC